MCIYHASNCRILLLEINLLYSTGETVADVYHIWFVLCLLVHIWLQHLLLHTVKSVLALNIP